MLVPRLILGAAAYLSLAAATLHSPPTGNCSRHDLNVLSCSPESLTTDACCVESPGGLLLLTQLYSKTAGGPENTWTVHGLWNDYCNGSYPSSCDASRNYVDIASTLKEHGQDSLLDYMKEHWRVSHVLECGEDRCSNDSHRTTRSLPPRTARTKSSGSTNGASTAPA